MVIRNLLHPTLASGNMFVVKEHTRRKQVVALFFYGTETDTLALHRIKFQSPFHGCKVTSMRLSLCLAFVGTVQKGQGQILKKLVVDIRSRFSSPGQLYLSFKRIKLLICSCSTNKVTLYAGRQHLRTFLIALPSFFEKSIQLDPSNKCE